MHKKYINVFVEIDVILGLYDLKSHIKYTHNTHSQALAAILRLIDCIRIKPTWSDITNFILILNYCIMPILTP